MAVELHLTSNYCPFLFGAWNTYFLSATLNNRTEQTERAAEETCLVDEPPLKYYFIIHSVPLAHSPRVTFMAVVVSIPGLGKLWRARHCKKQSPNGVAVTFYSSRTQLSGKFLLLLFSPVYDIACASDTTSCNTQRTDCEEDKAFFTSYLAE